MRLDLLACPSLSLFRHHPVRHLQGWAGLQTRYCLWHQGLSDQRHTGNTKDALSPQSSFWHTCEMRTHEPQGNTSINPGLLAELWERSFGSGPTQQTTTGPKSHDQTHLYRCLIGLYFTSHLFLFKLFLESFYDDVTTKSNPSSERCAECPTLKLEHAVFNALILSSSGDLI